MRLLVLFFDGVGLGPDEPRSNPFATVATPTLDALAGGAWSTPRPVVARDHLFVPVDATLGVDGLPQSATGQSTLISGRDAVRAMDGHYGPWPGPTLKRFLADGELFSWSRERFGGEAVAWAAAYPPGFFDALDRRRLRLNALAHAARSAGVTLPGLDAYRLGDAIAADLDGAYFASLGVEPPDGHRPGPEGAARAGTRLARRSAGRRLTFLDVWGTDRAGHAADMDAARDWVVRIDAFLASVLEARPPELTVLVVSDHGNLEDVSHGRHTRAPVPLVIVGPGAASFADARSLRDVAPSVRAAWDSQP